MSYLWKKRFQTLLTSVIFASTPCSAAHLNVLSRSDPAEASPIKFAGIREDDCLGRHVQASREGFSRKESLQ